MSARLRVPADLPDLPSALAAARDGDLIEIEGVVTGGVRVEKAVTLAGGTVRGGGLRAVVLAADARLVDLRVENPEGHGVRVEAGAPTLERVTVAVKETALAALGEARPVVRAVTVARCNNGFLSFEGATPAVSGLQVYAAGGGLVFRDRAAGAWRAVGLVTGSFAAVECGGETAPLFEDLELRGATGGVYVHGRARPVFRGLRVLATGYAGVEATGEADPTVDGATLRETRGSGLYLHGQSRGTWMDVDVQGAGLPGVEVGEQAAPELERVRLRGCGAAGLRATGEARVEAIALEVAECGTAVIAGDRAEVALEAPDLVALAREAVLATGEARVRIHGGRVLGGVAGVVVEAGARVEATPDTRIEAGGDAVRVASEGGERVLGR